MATKIGEFQPPERLPPTPSRTSETNCHVSPTLFSKKAYQMSWPPPSRIEIHYQKNQRKSRNLLLLVWNLETKWRCTINKGQFQDLNETSFIQPNAAYFVHSFFPIKKRKSKQNLDKFSANLIISGQVHPKTKKNSFLLAQSSCRF